jgi:hypothetical protein
MHAAIELWYLKTRFAYRIPLDEVITALLGWPGDRATWTGGGDGGWADRAPEPAPEG